jgi:AcrR family transcriptional regulator
MNKTEKTQPAEAPDGRRQRSERSRQAIIDAAMALIGEGILVPTAQLTSERAGVGIRTVFRHFSDMESLLAEADAQSREGYEALFIGGDRDGTVKERILHAVERHAEGFETTRNHNLAAHAQMWRYETMRKNYSRYQRGLRKDLDDWLPELKDLSKSQRIAVDAAASFEVWNRLRQLRGLSIKASIEIITEMLEDLILPHLK